MKSPKVPLEDGKNRGKTVEKLAAGEVLKN